MIKQKTVLGHSTLNVKRIGLGCMGMSEFYGSFNENESLNTLHKAIDLGINFFDTADMYGWGAYERLLGKAFKGRWSDVILATKFAVMRGPNGEFLGLNGKPEYIRQACEQSLKTWESISLIYTICIDRITKLRLKKLSVRWVIWLKKDRLNILVFLK